MSDFINGKIKQNDLDETSLFKNESFNTNSPQIFSRESEKVMNSGRELWKYYHSKENVNVNASLYEIREYFQGRNDKGKMNNFSDDEIYTELIDDLRDNLKLLAKKIEPKIFEYRFLIK